MSIAIDDYTIVSTGVNMSDLGVLESSNYLTSNDSIKYEFNANSSNLMSLSSKYNINVDQLKKLLIIVGVAKVKDYLKGKNAVVTTNDENNLQALKGTNFYVYLTADINEKDILNISNFLRKLRWL